MQSIAPSPAGQAQEEASDVAALAVAATRDNADPSSIRISGDKAAETAKTATAEDLADAANTDEKAAAQPPPLPLSKSQQKKELRCARSAQLHASKKALKKAQDAERKAAKAAEVQATIQAMTPEVRQAWEAVREGRRAERRELAAAKRERLQRALSAGHDCSLKVIIDCGYPEGMMTPSEARSLAGQLARCVGSNARAERPARLTFAGIKFPLVRSSSSGSAPSSPSLSSSTAQLLSERLANIDGHERWPVRWLPSLEGEAAADAAAADADAAATANAAESGNNNGTTTRMEKNNSTKLLYLSADAERELSASLDAGSTLVVGGLVDRNRHRGAALSRARSLRIEAARLPLQSLGGAVLSSSGVLTVDQTFALLLAAANAGSGSGGGGEGVGEEGKEEEGEERREGKEEEEKTTEALRFDWAVGVRAAVPTRKLARGPPREQQQEASGAREA